MADRNQLDQNRRNYNLDKANSLYAFNRAKSDVTFANQQTAQYISTLNEQTQVNIRNQENMIAWQEKENMRLYSYELEAQAYEASVDTYSRQLGFNNIAHKIALNDTARAYEDTLTSLGFQDRDLLLKYYEGGQTAAYETKGLGERLKQAEAAQELQIKGVKLNKEVAEAEAALRKVGLRQELDATRAKAAFRTQDLRKEYIEKEGAQRNLGQAGRSARKSIQALLAAHGSTQAAIVDSITRADAREELDFRQISQSLLNTYKQSNLKYEEIAQTMVDTVNQTKYQQQGIDLKFKQLGLRTEFGREQVQASRDSAGRQYDADRQRQHLSKYQADINAYGNLRPKPNAPPQAALPLELPLSTRQTLIKPQYGPKPEMEPDMVEGKNWMGQIVTTAALAGAAVVTGGASMPLTSQAFTSAAIGQGASGVSSWLSDEY